MNKAVFLDRDGTINVEKNYIYRIEDFEFLDNAIKGLQKLQDLGFILIIVTNQSGIGRGYYTEDDFNALNNWMLGQLEEAGAHITDVLYCPHLPDAQIRKYRKICDCRKPALGMFMKAVAEYDIDLNKSWTIGDKIRDCAICEKSECRGILIGNNEKTEVIDDVIAGKVKNVTYADSLYEASLVIRNFEIQSAR
jgi:D-glycero-D-manno-heptose 1,7-bisphosphate phosphatase